MSGRVCQRTVRAGPDSVRQVLARQAKVFLSLFHPNKLRGCFTSTNEHTLTITSWGSEYMLDIALYHGAAAGCATWCLVILYWWAICETAHPCSK